MGSNARQGGVGYCVGSWKDMETRPRPAGYIGWWSKREIRTGSGPRKHRPHYKVPREREREGSLPRGHGAQQILSAPCRGCPVLRAELTTMARGFLNQDLLLWLLGPLGHSGAGLRRGEAEAISD